jgi:hypothetical protein
MRRAVFKLIKNPLRKVDITHSRVGAISIPGTYKTNGTQESSPRANEPRNDVDLQV